MKKLLILSALFLSLNLFVQGILWSGWITQSSGVEEPLRDVCFVDTLHGWIAACSDSNLGLILRTTNGGKNWEKIYIEPSNANRNLVFTTIGFIDSLEGWVGGYEDWHYEYTHHNSSVLLHSIDGGNTWQNKQNMSSYKNPVFSNKTWVSEICIVDSTHGFYRTGRWYQDSGTARAGVGVGSLDRLHSWGSQEFYGGIGICFVDSLHGWLLMINVWGDSASLFYTDKGVESLSVIYKFYWHPYPRDINFVDTLHGWIVRDEGRIFYTQDAGSSWVEQSSWVTDSLYTVDFIDSLNGWVAGDNGVIIRTRDGGNNWIVESTPTSSKIRSVCFVDTSNGWAVGDDGKILHYTTLGLEEQEVSAVKGRLEIQPNPSFGSAIIKYRVPRESEVRLRLYNLSGQLIKVLVNEHKSAGSYSIGWKPPQAGIYFCQIKAGKFTDTKKLTFVR